MVCSKFASGHFAQNASCTEYGASFFVLLGRHLKNQSQKRQVDVLDVLAGCSLSQFSAQQAVALKQTEPTLLLLPKEEAPSQCL